MPEQYAYPFDPHGTNPANRILDERKTVSPAQYRDYVFVMPRWAPFFESSLVVRHWPSGVVIPPETGWVGTHIFQDASHSTATRICGSFSLKTVTSGVVSYDYQTIGGQWTISEEQIIEIISNTLLNPRITTWEHVTGVPEIFPVINHNWRIDDLVGAFELMESIDSVAEAILQQYSEDDYLHANDMNNPHGTTAAQVGAYSSIQMDAILEEYQLKNEAIANSIRIGGLTLAQLRQAVFDDGTSNANTLGGMSLAQLQQYISEATVTDTVHFDGKTYAQMREILDSEYTARLIVPAVTDTAASVRFVRLLRIPNNIAGVPFVAPFQCFVSGIPALSPTSLGFENIHTTALLSLMDTNTLLSAVVALTETVKPNYLHVEAGVGFTDLWYRIPIGETMNEITFTFVDNRPRGLQPGTTTNNSGKQALTVYEGNRSLINMLRNETEQEFITLIDTMRENFDYMTAQINALT